MNRFCGHLQSF